MEAYSLKELIESTLRSKISPTSKLIVIYGIMVKKEFTIIDCAKELSISKRTISTHIKEALDFLYKIMDKEDCWEDMLIEYDRRVTKKTYMKSIRL